MGATATTVVTTALAVCVVTLLVVLLLLRQRAAAERTRRERLEQELSQARTDVAVLGRRLDDLGHEVLEARSAADRAAARPGQLASHTEREFVITSLGETPSTPPAPRGAPRRVSGLLEERLLQVAGRHTGSSSAVAATRLAVGAAALGHGVRRALSPDVLDRAAAEATVARRRSRRERKRELREARRVVRAMQEGHERHERPPGKHVA